MKNTHLVEAGITLDNAAITLDFAYFAARRMSWYGIRLKSFRTVNRSLLFLKRQA